jgi:hypothetical protein
VLETVRACNGDIGWYNDLINKEFSMNGFIVTLPSSTGHPPEAGSSVAVAPEVLERLAEALVKAGSSYPPLSPIKPLLLRGLPRWP